MARCETYPNENFDRVQRLAARRCECLRHNHIGYCKDSLRTIGRVVREEPVLGWSDKVILYKAN